VIKAKGGNIMSFKIENSIFQMGDNYPKFKAAAVQAAPVFLDRDATIDKACVLIEEAAQHGADLVALPEVFVPGHAYWAWHMPWKDGMKYSIEYYKNAVEIPSPATDKIAETARKNNIYVAIGVNERDNKTLYNTLLYFDREGRLFGKHRKLKATGAEKLVWGDGDGSTHRVYPTEVGRLGGLICGEHAAVMPGYALGGMAQQVNISAWVGFVSVDPDFAEICSRYHAIAYNTFVICTQSLVDESVTAKLGNIGLREKTAWTAIIEPGTGRIIGGPLKPDEEGIVYADIDTEKCIEHYFKHEGTGHYCGKQFQVFFDTRETRPFNIIDREKCPPKKLMADFPEAYVPENFENEPE